ncbi:hypothetical protein BT63DRAFT_49736 [Microthyrium microscopicum]|uniref:Uncharacterized protein n=1 Tax=Microthyrium microscopicum TaxID=703497 RepID=A0A6A6U1V6_9PEZI|nr:hypothetical protein BT63DRAFT_49736 [Microthyrium microscopicum]
MGVVKVERSSEGAHTFDQVAPAQFASRVLAHSANHIPPQPCLDFTSTFERRQPCSRLYCTRGAR